MSIDEESQNSHMSKEIEELTRLKVVRELHDGLTQTVSALAMRINFARRLMISNPDAAEKELEKVENLVRETAREIRHMIFILRPKDIESQGLNATLEALVGTMDDLFNQEIELIINENLIGHLPLNDQQVIYSIVEEAIDSARKRSGTNHILVHLDRIDEQVAQLEIEEVGNCAAQEERPFQGQELESIQKFAALISGSVSVKNEGMLVRILFPFNLTAEEDISPIQ
jgi:signal transduction histidine kinase